MSFDNYIDTTWDLDDAELEAELQRQLDDMTYDENSEDDAGSASGDVKFQQITPVDENKSFSANNQIISDHDNYDADGTSSSLPSQPSPPVDSAWSQLMATVNAETDHWDQYESELTTLRTSMASFVPRSEENSTKTAAGTAPPPTSPNSAKNQFMGLPLPSDQDDEDVTDPIILTIDDPEKYVEEVQKRFQTLLSDEENDDEEDTGEKNGEDGESGGGGGDIETTSEIEGGESTTAETTMTTETSLPSLTSTNPNDLAFRSRANDILRQSNVDDLVQEAKSQMTADERQWRADNAQHEDALRRDIAMQQEERIIMEREASAERAKLKRIQMEREQIIQEEATRKQTEIEEQARRAAEQRKAMEEMRERQRVREQEQMEQFQRELEEADREREREMERAKKEEEAKAFVLKQMRVRWTLEERCAKTIQHRVRNMRAGKVVLSTQLSVAIFLQKWRRGFIGRRRAQVKRRKCASLLLQKWYRSRSNRIKYLSNLETTRSAVTRMQSTWRGHARRRQCIEKMQERAEQRARQREQASTVLSSRWQGFVQRRQFLETRAASTLLCSAVRSFLVRGRLTEERKMNVCAVKIQSYARGWKGREKVKSLQMEQRQKSLEKEKKEMKERNELHMAREKRKIQEREDRMKITEDEQLLDDGDDLFGIRVSPCDVNMESTNVGRRVDCKNNIINNKNKQKSSSSSCSNKKSFPPTMPDQVLCKENQRHHMKKQREQWMEERERVEQVRPIKGAEESITVLPYTMPTTASVVGTSTDENERLYDHWYRRATEWQTASANQNQVEQTDNVFNRMRTNKISLQHDLTNRLEQRKQRRMMRKKEERVTMLKEKLLKMSRELRILKEKRDIDGIKQMVPSMKTLKTEYEDAVKTAGAFRITLLEKRDDHSHSTMYDYSTKRQFVCNVESLVKLPIDQLRSLGGRLMSVVANTNRLSDVLELAEICWTKRGDGEGKRVDEDDEDDEDDKIDGTALLEWLSLRDNRLKSLAGVAPLLSTLEHLSIEMNDIGQLDDLLYCCSGDAGVGGGVGGGGTSATYPLRTLLASNNRIQSLGPLCYNNIFKCLETLALYRNNICEIPPGLTAALPNLRHLDLGRNKITSVENLNLDACPLLETLILYENLIDKMPVTRNVCLREVWMNGNQLVDLSPLSNGISSWGPSVETLYLHDNQIKSLDRGTLLSYPMLRVLDLSFNQLSSLDDLRVLSGCPHITSLKLNDNPLCDLPDYRRRVLLALPHLMELDNETVLVSEHNALRNHVYGADSGMIEAWLGKHDEFQRAISVISSVEDKNEGSSLQIDWHEVSYRRDISSVNNISDGSGSSAAWQNFETMCTRHRREREKRKLDKRKAEEEMNGGVVGVVGSDSNRSMSDPRSVLLSFEHDRLTREILQVHLKDHRTFQWHGLRSGKVAPGHVVISSYTNMLKKALKKTVTIKEAKANQMIQQTTMRVVGSRGSSRGSTSDSDRGRTAGEAAIMLQSLWRGYSHRKSPLFFAFASKMCERAAIAADAVEKENQEKKENERSVRMGSMSEIDGEECDDFNGVDVDGFLGGMDLDVDEFDYMQQNTTTTKDDHASQNQRNMNSVRTGWFDEGSNNNHKANDDNQPNSSYQRAARDAEEARNIYNQLQQSGGSGGSGSNPINGKSSGSGSHFPPSFPPMATSVPPSPASSASSFGGGSGSGSGGRTNMANLSSLGRGNLLPTPGTPAYERRHRHADRKHEDKVDKVAKDWGFEDKKTANLWMARQSRFQRAKVKKQRNEKLKDPSYKYKVLMRKVREEKERSERDGARNGGGSSSARKEQRHSRTLSRPPTNNSTRSSVQRDRQRHRKTKQKTAQPPAWAREGNERMGTASTTSSRMTVESVGSSASSDLNEGGFRVTEWSTCNNNNNNNGSRSQEQQQQQQQVNGLQNWGMNQQVPNQLPPIGL